MSKETTLIVLGLFIMALRTLLGLPGTWQTAALVLCGGAVAMIGFLQRGEALSRGVRPHRHNVFVEAHPDKEVQPQPNPTHEQKEGITSLN